MHCPSYDCVSCPPRWDQGPAAMNMILCNDCKCFDMLPMVGKHVGIYKKRFCEHVWACL